MHRNFSRFKYISGVASNTFSFNCYALSGPSDFVLDLMSVQNLSLQLPYIMVRCSTSGAPVFGIWSHKDQDLVAIHALLVRYGIEKYI
jgi:hypothetical protein